MGVSTTCDDCAPSSRWAATVVTFRPDGSDLRVLAHGIRDGVGLAYDGDRRALYVSIDQADDLGAATPGDWLAEVRAGQDWGFPTCHGQGGTACRDVPSPLATLDRHAGVGGVALLGRSAVVAEWARGRVKAVALDGSERGTVTTLLAGLRNPMPLLATSEGLFVGEWATGRVDLVSFD